MLCCYVFDRKIFIQIPAWYQLCLAVGCLFPFWFHIYVQSPLHFPKTKALLWFGWLIFNQIYVWSICCLWLFIKSVLPLFVYFAWSPQCNASKLSSRNLTPAVRALTMDCLIICGFVYLFEHLCPCLFVCLFSLIPSTLQRNASEMSGRNQTPAVHPLWIAHVQLTVYCLFVCLFRSSWFFFIVCLFVYVFVMLFYPWHRPCIYQAETKPPLCTHYGLPLSN